MRALNPVAGVDVGKGFLDLDFDPAAKALRVRNDAPGIAALIEAMRRRGANRVALEAIGQPLSSLSESFDPQPFRQVPVTPRRSAP